MESFKFLIAMRADTPLGQALTERSGAPGGLVAVFPINGIRHPVMGCTEFHGDTAGQFVRMTRPVSPDTPEELQTLWVPAAWVLLASTSEKQSMPLGFVPVADQPGH